ncbi:MAG: adenosylcobinamide-phosphate synthase CbiB [Treponema sp.]|jgi:adenosylcobinamide-phosphate synthase|nr:adenosylcobinamide-phosphate synthase CbiB [Treponema sp.]
MTVLAAFILDAILGDPHWAPHPVRAFGFFIVRGEAVLRRLFPFHEKRGGIILVIALSSSAFAVPLIILIILYRVNFWAGFITGSFLAYQTIAARNLRDAAMRVYREARSENLAAARNAVAMIVGRDTERLSMEGVIKAAVETVAENLSDGVIAPLCFLALGGPAAGPALAFFYKAASTLDSMIGYKTAPYIHFGRAAAKLDDVLNFIPARLSAAFLIAAAFFSGFDGKNALRVYVRDREKHASPNAGHPESACAGAIDLALAGSAYYGGVLEKKPLIGDGTRAAEAGDIKKACKLMYAASILFLPLAAVFETAVSLFWRSLCI